MNRAQWYSVALTSVVQESAEEVFRKSIALRPWDAAAPTRNLGRVLMAQHRLEEAVPVLSQVAANDKAEGASDDEVDYPWWR